MQHWRAPPWVTSVSLTARRPWRFQGSFACLTSRRLKKATRSSPDGNGTSFSPAESNCALKKPPSRSSQTTWATSTSEVRLDASHHANPSEFTPQVEMDPCGDEWCRIDIILMTHQDGCAHSAKALAIGRRDNKNWHFHYWIHSA